MKFSPILKKVLLVLIVGVAVYLQNNAEFFDSAETGASGNVAIVNAFKQHHSDVQVSGSGKISRLLPDDNKGSRHQRFLIQISAEQTILIAHNIDLAPRIDGLRKGDQLAFRGEYEWNEKGGVVHWTHHDPAGRHADGWLEHQGRKYQ